MSSWLLISSYVMTSFGYDGVSPLNSDKTVEKIISACLLWIPTNTAQTFAKPIFLSNHALNGIQSPLLRSGLSTRSDRTLNKCIIH